MGDDQLPGSGTSEVRTWLGPAACGEYSCSDLRPSTPVKTETPDASMTGPRSFWAGSVAGFAVLARARR